MWVHHRSAPGSERAVKIIIVLLIEFGQYTVLSKQLLQHYGRARWRITGVSTEWGCTIVVLLEASGRSIWYIHFRFCQNNYYITSWLCQKRFKVLSGRITGSGCFQRMWAGDESQWIILEWRTRTYFKPNQAQHPQLQHSTGSTIPTCNLYIHMNVLL